MLLIGEIILSFIQNYMLLKNFNFQPSIVYNFISFDTFGNSESKGSHSDHKSWNTFISFLSLLYYGFFYFYFYQILTIFNKLKIMSRGCIWQLQILTF
jgi:hypothetical protein